MSFTTYTQGLIIATDLAAKAIAVEATLPNLSRNASPLSTLHKAFPLYVEAASAYSHLISSNLVPASEKAAVTKKWRLVLERAEKVKKRIEELGGSVGKVAGDDGEEDAVKRRGGVMNGVKTDLWIEPSNWEFTANKADIYVDIQQPELADEQIRLDPEWKALSKCYWIDTGRDKRWMVRQGPGADCSVVAGLGVCMEHNRTWGTSLGESSLYPQAASGQPTFSENGKHIVKLLLNGVWRSMVIDALLPRTKFTHTPLHAISYPFSTTSNGIQSFSSLALASPQPTSVGPPWLPLTVKAYFKTLGGYSIAGSDPSRDIYALTGWIPERISLKEGFQREKEWKRIWEGWKSGKCLITLGTAERVDNPKLVPSHAYGVLSLQDEGERLLSILDPGSSRDTSAMAAKGPLEHMSWDIVCSEFASLHLNWDPALFPVSAVRHWSWPKPPTSSTEGHAAALNPHYSLTVNSSMPYPEIWLLLSQHSVSKDRRLEDIALHVIEDHGATSKKNVVEPSQAGDATPYTNGLHTLVRYQPRKDTTHLMLIAARDHGIYQTGFTLSAFAPQGCLLKLERISRSMPFSQTINGALASKNAGGHPGFSSFMSNPQFKLSLPAKSNGSSVSTPRPTVKAEVRMLLNGDKDLAWNVKLVWSKGELVFDLTKDSVITDSGAYSFGMACCYTPDLDAGEYTVIISTFEPRQIGSYTLTIESTLGFSLEPIPPEGAGMYNRTINGKWTEGTSFGRPSLGSYAQNPKIELIISAPTNFFARLHLPTPLLSAMHKRTPSAPTPSITITTPNDTIIAASSAIPAIKTSSTAISIPINLTLFRRDLNGEIGEQVITSGPYSDRLSGVCVPANGDYCGGRSGKVKLDTGIYLAVVSTYEAGIVRDWRIQFWGDKAFSAELVK